MKRAPDSERRRVCGQCAKVFFVSPKRIGAFCSTICKAESLRTTPRPDPRPCIVCATVFKPSRHHGDAKHCSKRCEWVTRGGAEFSARVARDSARARGDAQRGTGTLGYVKEYGRHQHRVVAERTIGRPLEKGEIVHHLDGNKKNNAPENLVVMTQAEHIREHRLWEKRWPK